MNQPQAQQIPAPPHDIGGLEAFPDHTLYYVVAAGFLLALLVGLAIYLWKKRSVPDQVPAEPEAPAPQQNPYDQAIRSIESLVPIEPFRGSVCEDYYAELGIGLRQVLELRLNILATGSAYQELSPQLPETLPNLGAEASSELHEFLRFSESIKFAGYTPTLQQAEDHKNQVLQWARGLVGRSQ